MGRSADHAGKQPVRLNDNRYRDAKMSGWQLAEKIKGNYPEMKVAVVTGWGPDVSDEEKARYGVRYVLGKPILLDQLKQMVAEVLQMKEDAL